MSRQNESSAAIAPLIDFEQFLAIDIRVGRITDAAVHPTARKPSYVLMIDFGPDLGVKKSSAQITQAYEPDALIGRFVAAVVNFPPRQVGNVMSQVLTLGFPDSDGAVILCTPDREVPLGSRLF